jgi:hypothetical protein
MDKLIEKLKTIETVNSKKPFSLLEMLYQKVDAKEVAQSEMLAGLLSPDENHGHVSYLAESFLKEIGVDAKLDKDSNLKIETERNAGGRRIDILISWSDGNKEHAVIIENKLHNAANQANQLNDYHDSLCSEGCIVDKIVYMPLEKWRKSEHIPDIRPDVLDKTVDFCAENIVKWINDMVKPDKGSAIDQYKEFLDCLISNKYLMQNSVEIQQKLSIEEINKLEELAKIVATPEWSLSRVKSITDKLMQQFPNLKVEGKYRIKTAEHYVQFFFKPYKYWAEFWWRKNFIRLYICSHEKKEKVIINDISYDYDEYDNSYHYYRSSNYSFDHFNESGLIETLKPILQELLKYSEDRRHLGMKDPNPC